MRLRKNKKGQTESVFKLALVVIIIAAVLAVVAIVMGDIWAGGQAVATGAVEAAGSVENSTLGLFAPQKMHDVVFKLALAVILGCAIFFLLGTTFSGVSESTNMTVSNMEDARRTSLNMTASYLQQ